MLCTHLAAVAQLPDANKLLHAVQQRERSGTTFLPTGLAIPHARLPDITDVHMVLGLHPQGFLESLDDGTYPMHVICLFCSPAAGEAFGKHLQILAKIAAVFHDTDAIRSIAQCATPQSAFTQLQQMERAALEHAHPPAA